MGDYINTRTCKECGQTKPLEAFIKHKSMEHGRGNRCKECRAAETRERRKAGRGPGRTCTTCGVFRSPDLFAETEPDRCIPCLKAPPNTVRCSRCRKYLPLNDFATDARRKRGVDTYCRACRAASKKAWVERNRETVREDVYARSIKRLYGIGLEEYERMVERQGNLCAICGQPETKTNKDGTPRRLQVDHDHLTNQIRDLVCSRCNFLVGNIETSPQVVDDVLAYLERWGPTPR